MAYNSGYNVKDKTMKQVTRNNFEWVRLQSAIPCSITIPSNSPVELIDGRYFVSPSIFPKDSIEHHDAVHYGIHVSENNVVIHDKKQTLNKIVTGKKYLLGSGTDGTHYDLLAPSWDCGWYWGFGYVQSKGSHEHIPGFLGEQVYYEKGERKESYYIHNIYDSPRLEKVTFTEKEGWQLSELFKQFYLLKNMAEFCHRSKPNCHITTSPVDHGNMSGWNQHINNVMIPKITAEVLRILSPEK